MTEMVTPSQFHASDGTEDWRVLCDGACAYFRTGSFAAGARFVEAIAQLEGLDEHAPDVDVRADGVTVRLVTITDTDYSVSRRDVEMARAVSKIARTLGFAADPAMVQSVLIIPGATDVSSVMPFWQAMLGYSRRPDSPDEDLIDPRRRGPAFWFERMDEPRGDGLGAVHVSVWLPFEQAAARVSAALAAGGRMVRDEFAPMWWTLADAAGNEADISTAQGRG
jgi:4a-hydroxytetrahydrobiopterin dehydratase